MLVNVFSLGMAKKTVTLFFTAIFFNLLFLSPTHASYIDDTYHDNVVNDILTLQDYALSFKQNCAAGVFRRITHVADITIIINNETATLLYAFNKNAIEQILIHERLSLNKQRDQQISLLTLKNKSAIETIDKAYEVAFKNIESEFHMLYTENINISLIVDSNDVMVTQSGDINAKAKITLYSDKKLIDNPILLNLAEKLFIKSRLDKLYSCYIIENEEIQDVIIYKEAKL